MTRIVSRDRYSAVAIVLHWLIAAALIFQVLVAWRMHDLKTPLGFALTQLHKSVGITVLLLSLVRLGWRLANPPPPGPPAARAAAPQPCGRPRAGARGGGRGVRGGRRSGPRLPAFGRGARGGPARATSARARLPAAPPRAAAGSESNCCSRVRH